MIYSRTECQEPDVHIEYYISNITRDAEQFNSGAKCTWINFKKSLKVQLDGSPL